MSFSISDSMWREKSWVESANEPQCGFPLQNLPFCSFLGGDGRARLGVGIGDQVLDLHECAERSLLLLGEPLRTACLAPTLNEVMSTGVVGANELRRELLHLLGSETPAGTVQRLRDHLRPMRDASFCKPVAVGNYTDFYASIHHATNVGRLFRPDQPLLPNYKWVPIGYHGRASSIVTSGTPVPRPRGQVKPSQATTPSYVPSRQLDFELELGCYIGAGNRLGTPIPVMDANDHIWGVSLVNDWSARDVQAWEYQPLGPFLGKSFRTSVSPWVVTSHALAPFRTANVQRAAEDPGPLPYLQSSTPESDGFDLTLEVHIMSERMREERHAPMLITRSNARHLYWSFRQMIAHHTSNGCNLQPGDLLASGTVSGPSDGSFGCLLEMTERGARALTLPTGETRSFLEDGDEIVLSGYGEREGFPRISLGECSGQIVAAQL